MVKLVMERMRELEQAIHSSENDPSRLARISRKLQLAGQEIGEMMEEIMTDEGIKQKEELAGYLVKYILYAMLLHPNRGGRARLTGGRLGSVVTYKGSAIDLIVL